LAQMPNLQNGFFELLAHTNQSLGKGIGAENQNKYV